MWKHIAGSEPDVRLAVREIVDVTARVLDAPEPGFARMPPARPGGGSTMRSAAHHELALIEQADGVSMPRPRGARPDHGVESRVVCARS